MRIIGFVIAAIGLMLLAVGLDADAPLERVSKALTGRYTDATMWYLIAGIVALVVGALLAAFGPRRV
jgi:Protein of unknown function (DUF3185).